MSGWSRIVSHARRIASTADDCQEAGCYKSASRLKGAVIVMRKPCFFNIRPWRPVRFGSAIALAIVLIAPALSQAANFQQIGQTRAIKGAPGLYESHYIASVGPTPFDLIGLHLIAKGATPPKEPAAVVLYLPGTNMNGEVAIEDRANSLPIFIAGYGIDVWSMDYRTHFIPPETPMKDLGELKQWTNQLFESDIEQAAKFVQAQTHAQKIFVAGFSRGVEFAYLYAAMHAPDVAGIIALDGFIPPPGQPLIANASKDPAEDIGGPHLTYDKRKKLMQMVIDNPNQPAPIPKYKTARENLEHVVYDAGGVFGGKGGLADPISGKSDAVVLARLLITYDRYWPTVQDGDNPFTPELLAALNASKIPVIAFASTNFGKDWPTLVAQSAKSTGTPDPVLWTLKGWGHLDVLVGSRAQSEVYGRTVVFIMQHRG
jgi:pimeloyl-ACP methyl ester carboxylesterase